ncbi:MAG: TrkH family potassium uptake protein [Pseudomonadota bacterium]
MDLRPVLFVMGMLLTILAMGMVLPMLADLQANSADWKVFLSCIVITLFFGGSLILSNSGHDLKVNIHQAFLLIVLSWVFIATFGALPFYLCELKLSFADSIFETMSGITTTGSTVITNLEEAPRGILLWRGILQWFGGIGIILMAMSVLPFLNVGGMQIFRTELSESEKVLPKAAKLASSIGMIYTGLTVICAFCYGLAGMGMFDSVVHALTTISTGGYSTFDTSFGHYNDPWTEIVAIIFMIVGGMPFVLYLQALRGNNRPLFEDQQVHFFLGVVFSSIFILTVYLVLHQDINLIEAIRRSSFNVVSLVTGTGYVNGDYGAWGGFAVSLLFFLMVVGGCAGSTSCGIKIFRFQVLIEVVSLQIKKLLFPNGVFIPHYNRRPMANDIPQSVMGFFFLYALCFSLLAISLSFTGLDFLSAMSGAATVISNVGPGLGEIIGPTGTFASIPDSAKWICTVGMLVGRLEIFPMIVLFSPHFWRN